MREVLDFLEPYNAGAFSEEVVAKYNLQEKKIVNLSSNENPYPLPKSVVKVIAEKAKGINRYPDSSYKKLKEALSKYTGLPQQNISVACGASEVLGTISKISLNALDKVTIPVPSYTMYVFFSMIHEANLDLFQMEAPDFELDVEKFIERARDAKLVFLCSPNNPTGKTIPREDIVKIVENTRGMVAVDEAYFEFSQKTVADKVNDYENLIVIRSMSKFFGLAGLRVGYALANEKVVAMMEKVRLPFGISTIAEMAAIEALKQIKYFEKCREKILKERSRMLAGINKIAGFKALPSEANFLLVCLQENGSEFSEALKKKGIIVRDVSGVYGLQKNYVRISVGKKEDTAELLAAMSQRKSILF